MRLRSVLVSISVVAVLGLVAALVIGAQSRVSPQAIQDSVTRTPDLIARAWQLLSTFKSDITWQSNGSRCGPAAIANAFRSIGEGETTEAEVLDGTGKCCTGICFMGFTLEELAEITQFHTERTVTLSGISQMRNSSST